jgi:chitinase
MKLFLFLLATAYLAQGYDLSMFYCGFGGNFCGQSIDDDVYAKTTTVILAFVNTQQDGSVIADEANFPTALISKWHAAGKKVVISVGGQNGNWPNVFANPATTANFINALHAIVLKYDLDGVDLDIENYLATPRTVADMINALRDTLGPQKLIIVSPEDVTVMQEFGVPSPDAQTGYYNYFVPIIVLADKSIDYYQPQAYNNWYEVPGGNLTYLQNVYLNWRNLQGLMTWAKPIDIPDFNGVAGEKLLMGVEASPDAGGSNYFVSPATIKDFKDWLAGNNHTMRGFMMWDSHWDALYNNSISIACTE